MKAIERWYTGKALETIRSYVLPTLAEAEQLGYWPKGASRKVRAALNKQNVAAKWAKANRVILESLSTGNGPYNGVRGGYIQHAMFFGAFSNAAEVVTTARTLRRKGKLWGPRDAGAVNYLQVWIDPSLLAELLNTAEQWGTDFTPVAALVEMLDARRPLPVIVCKTLSPTVAQHLTRSLEIDVASVKVPPTKYHWETVLDPKTGKECEVAVGVILWPKGTKHNQSRFAYGTAHNQTCHACGHAIRDPFNWVPLVADGASGPLSLWVGRDCARKIFGVDVSGDARYERAK